ncbi:nucleolar nop52 variant [Trichoderma arundinaceum]|uniref:Nucleolar nop52 variant n=1 Tax=Trichoderma arundinaceum TaxID=490622 RepID=A0A395NK26_TRIAR|nr:nucleolar nop52 variant [Trichoderma arundinaceum]
MAASAAVSAQEAQQMPFIRNLASSGSSSSLPEYIQMPQRLTMTSPKSDRKLRTESLSSLQAFLSSRRSITPLDARKLWTGLYYALWMTDRPRPQQALAADLANLLSDLQPACVEPWLAAFWSVLGTQWPHIEALRLDKFLLLVRRVFAAHVRLVKEQGYQGDLTAQILAVFARWCFDAEDEEKVALGLRLHVLDVWVDELEREGAVAAAQDNEHAKAFVQAVGALVDTLKRCPVKSLRQRAQDSYDDERLPWAEKKDDDDEDDEMEGAEGDEDDEWGGIDN